MLGAGASEPGNHQESHDPPPLLPPCPWTHGSDILACCQRVELPSHHLHFHAAPQASSATGELRNRSLRIRPSSAATSAEPRSRGRGKSMRRSKAISPSSIIK